MNCQAIDVKAYAFGEVSGGEWRDVESHMKSCDECRNEWEQLQMLQVSLGGLREEEPPRRIAFVSDKVFEPNWWQSFWASGPRVGFAGAGLLSAAILVHGFTRPATLINHTPPTAVVAQLDDQDVQKRIDTAVAKAVVSAEQRQKASFDQLLAANKQRYDLDRKVLAAAVEENMEYTRKRVSQMFVQTAGLVK